MKQTNLKRWKNDNLERLKKNKKVWNEWDILERPLDRL